MLKLTDEGHLYSICFLAALFTLAPFVIISRYHPNDQSAYICYVKFVAQKRYVLTFLSTFYTTVVNTHPHLMCFPRMELGMSCLFANIQA
jgi:hypothetical protein